jgi:hypothetical protein
MREIFKYVRTDRAKGNISADRHRLPPNRQRSESFRSLPAHMIENVHCSQDACTISSSIFYPPSCWGSELLLLHAAEKNINRRLGWRQPAARR